MATGTGCARRRVGARIAVGAVVALWCLVAAACTGDDAQEGRYGAPEVQRVATVRPVTPGWPDWPEQPEKKQPSGLTLEEAAAKDPILAEYVRQTHDVPADDDADSGNKWSDDDKLGNLTASAYESAGDAERIFRASNDLARAYAAEYGVVTGEDRVEGLGDEAWRLSADWNGTQVTYHWRRDNVVLEVHVHCYGDCPDDVDGAARSWAEAVDAELQRSA